jgi:hypothetical protein
VNSVGLVSQRRFGLARAVTRESWAKADRISVCAQTAHEYVTVRITNLNKALPRVPILLRRDGRLEAQRGGLGAIPSLAEIIQANPTTNGRARLVVKTPDAHREGTDVLGYAVSLRDRMPLVVVRYALFTPCNPGGQLTRH